MRRLQRSAQRTIPLTFRRNCCSKKIIGATGKPSRRTPSVHSVRSPPKQFSLWPAMTESPIATDSPTSPPGAPTRLTMLESPQSVNAMSVVEHSAEVLDDVDA